MFIGTEPTKWLVTYLLTEWRFEKKCFKLLLILDQWNVIRFFLSFCSKVVSKLNLAKSL